MIWAALLSIWEGAYRTVGWRPWVFPAPSHIFDALLGLLRIRTSFGDPLSAWWPRAAAGTSFFEPAIYASPMLIALAVSFTRLVIGFVVSVVAGMLLGMLMWRNSWLDNLLGPLFLGFQTLPSVCWVPLGIVVFGLSEQGVLFVLVVGSCFAVAISMRDGLRTIPPLYQNAGRMLGAKGWKLYLYVLLPASLPALASSLRQGFSFAWRSLMGAELLFTANVQHGIGFLLDNSRNVGGVADVIAVMAVMVMIGMFVDRWFFAKLQLAVQRRFGLA